MSKQNKNRLWLDLGTFITLLLVGAPRTTGDTIHEWLALALGGAVIVHLLFNWTWIVEITARLLTKGAKNSWVNYFLNWALFLSGIMTILSGLMISRSVVPFFGLALPQGGSWRQLHELSTNMIVILMGFHLALHWSWIVNMFKHLSAPRLAPRVPSPAMPMQRKDVQA